MGNSYSASKIEIERNLEFLLNKTEPIFTVYKNDGLIKTTLKNVLNIFVDVMVDQNELILRFCDFS